MFQVTKVFQTGVNLVLVPLYRCFSLMMERYCVKPSHKMKCSTLGQIKNIFLCYPIAGRLNLFFPVSLMCKQEHK